MFPRRRLGDAPDAELLGRIVNMYVRDGMSVRQIAPAVGVRRQRVAQWLHAAGVQVAPRGVGRARPQQRRQDPEGMRELLEELYLRRGLTAAEAGALLGLPGRDVLARLYVYGIPTRTRGRVNREDRRHLDADDLTRLYLRAGLSADLIGRQLGVSRRVVLRAAHDLGLPVRVGGPPPRSPPQEIELIEALYADVQVAAVLARHAIPRVGPGRHLHERFPSPVPLPAPILVELYTGCGLGLRHIELLTGHPEATLRHRLQAAGIPARHPGGRTPFLRRWRAGQRSPRLGSLPAVSLGNL